MTDVALKVLVDDDRHMGATYKLVGPGRYNAHDLGRIISGVLGRTIRVEEIDADTYLNACFGDADRSKLQHEVRVLRAIGKRYSSHDFIGNPNVLTWLLERPPTTFEPFVRAQYTAFQARASVAA